MFGHPFGDATADSLIADREVVPDCSIRGYTSLRWVDHLTHVGKGALGAAPERFAIARLGVPQVQTPSGYVAGHSFAFSCGDKKIPVTKWANRDSGQ